MTGIFNKKFTKHPSVYQHLLQRNELVLKCVKLQQILFQNVKCLETLKYELCILTYQGFA